MTIFFVSQGIKYKEEIQDKYIWAPLKTKSGILKTHKNIEQVKKDDFIIHYYEQAISAISQAKKDYDNRIEQKNYNGEMLDGYFLDELNIEKLDNVDISLLKDKDILGEFARTGCPFTSDGIVKQKGYLFILSEDEAIYLLSKILNSKTTNNAAIKLAQKAIDSLDISHYEKVNILSSSNKKIEHDLNKPPKFQQMTKRSGVNIPKRDSILATQVLQDAKYKCELEEEEEDDEKNKHPTFIRADSDHNYMESHHLIPISKYKDFPDGSKFKNLDIPANIVSLCSNCHKLLHHGRPEDKKPLLKKLFNEQRKSELKESGIQIEFDKLCKYYDIQD